MFIFFPTFICCLFAHGGLRSLNRRIAGPLPSRRGPIYHSRKWMWGQVLMARIGHKSGNLVKVFEKWAEFSKLKQGLEQKNADRKRFEE
jgi:hypothetical protein